MAQEISEHSGEASLQASRALVLFPGQPIPYRQDAWGARAQLLSVQPASQRVTGSGILLDFVLLDFPKVSLTRFTEPYREYHDFSLVLLKLLDVCPCR